MTNEQLYLAIGIPILFNFGIFIIFITIFLWVLSGIKNEIKEVKEEIKSLSIKIDTLFEKYAEADKRVTALENK